MILELFSVDMKIDFQFDYMFQKVSENIDKWVLDV